MYPGPHGNTYPPPYAPAHTGLASPPLTNLSIKRAASQTPLVDESPQKKTTKWTQEEDELTVELRGAGMKWEDISKRIPGRSAISCRLRYQNYLEKRAHWDEEKKNKLARLYVRFKEQMWQRVASEMGVPWRSAEAMHWTLGPDEIATRANQPVFQLSAAATAAGSSASTSPHAQHPIPVGYAPVTAATSPPYPPGPPLAPLGPGPGFPPAHRGRRDSIGSGGRRRADSGRSGHPPMVIEGYGHPMQMQVQQQQRPPTSEGAGGRPYPMQVEYHNPHLRTEADDAASRRSFESSANGAHSRERGHRRSASRNGEERWSQGSRESPRSVHSDKSGKSGGSGGNADRKKDSPEMRK